MDSDYNSISQLLEKIEELNSIQRSILLDSQEAISNQVQISDYDYERAIKTIGTIESVVLEQQQVVQRPQIQMPNIDVNRGVAESAAGIRQRIEGAEIQKRVLVADKKVLDAAKEIGGIIGGAGKELQEQISEGIYKAKTSKLILPGLSIQDQVHELEGIEQGLNQEAFDSEQLKIIRQEVSGVEESAKRQESQMADESQKEMFDVRARLIFEIRNKLLNSNN